MKPGDLVTPIKNYATAYRLWDTYEGRGHAIVLDRLHVGELGIVLESTRWSPRTNYVLVLSPRGISGWTVTDNIEVIDETR